MSVVEVFKNQKYVVFNDVISREVCSLMTDYLFVKKEAGLLVPPVSMGGDDKQCPKSWSLYGDPLFDTLLARLAPAISNLIQVSLIPAYTYSRIYQRGEVLENHTDRPSCEISGTMTIGHKEGDPIWPIHVGKEKMGGSSVQGEEDRSITIDVGELMLYRGCDIPHWRTEYLGEWQTQVFFHYVDANGPYAQECKFDGRPCLGLPKNEQPKRMQEIKKPWETSSTQTEQIKKPWEQSSTTTQEQKSLPFNFEFKVGA